MRVLFIVHGFPPSSTGGTEIYAYELARALQGEHHKVVVLAREAREDLPEYGVRRDQVGDVAVVRVNNTFRHSSSFEHTYRNATLDTLAGGVLDEVGPDIVHVHHLTCLSTGIVEECTSRRVPVVLTLNDYWLFCHRGQLLDLDLERCAGPELDRCATCAGLAASSSAGLHGAGRVVRAVARHLPGGLAAIERRAVPVFTRAVVPASAKAEIARRLEQVREVCQRATRLVAPSQTALEQFVRFGVPRSRTLLQEQGIDLRPFAGVARHGSDRLRLGFIGSLLPSKAPHVLLEAVGGLPRDRVSVTIAGGLATYHGDDSYRSRIRPMLASGAVRWLDVVGRDRIPALLASLDVLVVPSVWIENAPFVVREAFAAGVPVVASNLGGLAEMVVDGHDGLLFRPGDAGDLRRVLTRFLDEPDLLEKLRRGIPSVKSIEEDAAWTAGLYDEVRLEQRPHHPSGVLAAHLAGAPSSTGAASPACLSEGAPPQATQPPVYSVVLNYDTPDDTLLAVRSLHASRRRLAEIIVVDNGKDEACEQALEPWRDSVRLTRTGANLGFAGGCNVGIRAALGAGAELILLLNSDALVAPDTIGRLERALIADPAAGIAAPLVVSRSEPSIVATAGIRFSSYSGRMRHEGFGSQTAELRGGQPRRVDAVGGCAMLIKRAVLEAAGLFDERYFYSFEDIDLCWRARRVGWEILLVPSAIAYHEGHRSIGAGSADRLYFAARNHLLLARSVAPAALLPSLGRAATIVLLNVAHTLRVQHISKAAALGAVARGTLDHVRGRYGAGPMGQE